MPRGTRQRLAVVATTGAGPHPPPSGAGVWWFPSSTDIFAPSSHLRHFYATRRLFARFIIRTLLETLACAKSRSLSPSNAGSPITTTGGFAYEHPGQQRIASSSWWWRMERWADSIPHVVRSNRPVPPPSLTERSYWRKNLARRLMVHDHRLAGFSARKQNSD